MNPLLPEELRHNLTSFIKRILNPLDVPEEDVNDRYDVENIIDNLPKGLKGKTNAEYALSLEEFDAIVKEIYPAVTFAEGVLERFHQSAEVYLSKLIKGGAKMAKEENHKTLQPKYTNLVRLAIFPSMD
jgi:histone H3/H4